VDGFVFSIRHGRHALRELGVSNGNGEMVVTIRSSIKIRSHR